MSYFACAAVTIMLYFDKCGLFLPSLSAVFLHEFSHLYVMCKRGYRPQEIIINASGIRIINNRITDVKSQILILLSGPLSNIISFFIFYILFLLLKNEYLLRIASVGLVFGTINFLPSENLDGGSILELLLANRLGIQKTEMILKMLTVTVTFSLFVFGGYLLCISNNPSVMLFAVYIFILSLLNFS